MHACVHSNLHSHKHGNLGASLDESRSLGDVSLSVSTSPCTCMFTHPHLAGSICTLQAPSVRFEQSSGKYYLHCRIHSNRRRCQFQDYRLFQVHHPPTCHAHPPLCLQRVTAASPSRQWPEASPQRLGLSYWFWQFSSTSGRQPIRARWSMLSYRAHQCAPLAPHLRRPNHRGYDRWHPQQSPCRYIPDL